MPSFSLGMSSGGMHLEMNDAPQLFGISAADRGAYDVDILDNHGIESRAFVRYALACNHQLREKENCSL